MEKLQKKLFTVKIIELAVLLCMLIIGFLPLTTFGFNFEVTNSVFTWIAINFGVGGVFALLYTVVFVLITVFSVLKFLKVLKLKQNDNIEKYYTKGILTFLLIVLSFAVAIYFAVTTSSPRMFIWLLIPAIVFAIVNMIVKGTNKKNDKVKRK